MKIPNLEYFLVVAEERNITKAAQSLYISQQSLSQYIKRLEDFYGTALFERTPHMRLTYAGECLVRAAEQINAIHFRLLRDFSELVKHTKGKVVLGIPRPTGSVIIPDIVPKYKHDYPEVELSYYEDDIFRLKEKTLSDELDMYISFEPVSEVEFTSIPLLNETLFAIVSIDLLKKYYPDHFEEKCRIFEAGVDLREFMNIPFVLNIRGNHIRNIIDNYFRLSGGYLNTAFETNSNVVTFELCMKNVGIGLCEKLLIPRIIRQRTAYGVEDKLMLYPITSPQYEHSVQLVYKKQKFLPEYMKGLISLIVDAFSTYI